MREIDADILGILKSLTKPQRKLALRIYREKESYILDGNTRRSLWVLRDKGITESAGYLWEHLTGWGLEIVRALICLEYRNK